MSEKVARLMRISAALLASLLLTATLAGCKSPLRECHESNEDYAGAKEMPPIHAPPGLETPDTRNALKVPPLNTPERVRGKDEPCLSAPPPFSTPKAAEPAKPPVSN
jgi:uncharacterized lipoprotein